MKDKIITFLFVGFVFIFLILNIVMPKNSVSYEERRYLKKMPSVSLTNIKNGGLFKDFDEYVVDNFSFRKIFRKVNVFYNLYVVGREDYKNYYIDKGYINKIEMFNKNKVISFSDKINKLYDKYLMDSSVYLSIIPDKSNYSDHINLKYNDVEDIVLDRINSNIKFINISDCLELDNYYYSDIHWRQERLNKVLNRFSENLNISLFDDLEEKYYDNFLGSYYGSVGGIGSSDKIVYLTNSVLSKASIYDIEGKIDRVYEEDKLDGMDSYDVFLGGATPLIRIDNNSSLGDRELIIFRDSFGSSIAPLLLKDYKSITLVDLRYIDYNMIGDYVDFKNKDILLLYNTTIINNSDIIKVN